MEGYRKFFRKISTPALPLFCIICITVIICYGRTFMNTSAAAAAGTVFAVIAAASLYEISGQLALKNRLQTVLCIFSFTLLCAALCFSLFKKTDSALNPGPLPEFSDNSIVRITEVAKHRYSTRLLFQKEGQKNDFAGGVIVFRGMQSFRKGDRIAVHKKIKQIAAENSSSYNIHLRRQGIHYCAFLKDSDITFIEKSPVPLKEKIRSRLLERSSRIFSKDASSLLKALYTGSKSHIEKRTLLTFRDAGILHVLAASGLHVAIVASIPLFLLVFPVSRRTIGSVSLVLVLAYLYITDAPVSLVRACLMFALFYIQSLFYRESNIFNILMLAGSCILFSRPWELFSPGFQLSFGATAGIIVFYRQYLFALRGIPGFIRKSFALTLSAQVLTVPVLYYHLDQVNLIGIASNLAVIPMISAILAASLACLFLSLFSLTAGIISGHAVNFIYTMIHGTASAGAAAGLNFHSPELTLPLILLYILTLVPLVPAGPVKKLKYHPVAAALILSILYLKEPLVSNEIKTRLSALYPGIKLLLSEKGNTIELNFRKTGSISCLTEELRHNSIHIDTVVVRNCSFANNLACRKIIAEFAVRECIIPESIIGKGSLSEILSMAAKDSIKISIEKKEKEKSGI